MDEIVKLKGDQQELYKNNVILFVNLLSIHLRRLEYLGYLYSILDPI